MNVIDTSCWLEYIAATERSELFSYQIEDVNNLIVPTIVLYETFKKLMIESDEDKALITIAYMKQAKIVDIDSSIALHAAKISLEYKLPMADSIIYAVTKKFNATLWTQDEHFEKLQNVKYFPKK